MKTKIFFKPVSKEDIKLGDTIIYNGFFHGLLENIDEVQLERIKSENIGLTYSRAEIEVDGEELEEVKNEIYEEHYNTCKNFNRFTNKRKYDMAVTEILTNLGIKIC